VGRDRGIGVSSYVELIGVQLLYRFVLFYVIASSSFPRIAPWVCICLGGVQGHPGDPTSWVPLGAALRASQGSPPLPGYAFKD